MKLELKLNWNLENASGEEEQECWFGEGAGCHKSSHTGEWDLERLKLLEWGKSVKPVYGNKPGSKLDWWWLI